ncbi:exported hypothetical protein [Vibrio coralliirubri]|nr:hypothetical protein [Vibrio coralliirubri]CDU01925.1 exported hypothetical protein [Vibrio coralliirubri]
MKKLFLISALTLFSASALAEKIPYLECGIEKSTYTTHDDKVIEVPPLVFRVKHGNDEPTVMLQTQWLAKLQHAWVHTVAIDGKRLENERMGLTSTVTLSWRYEMKPDRIVLYSEYGYEYTGNYFTKAIRQMVIERTSGNIVIFDDKGGVNTEGRCETVKVKF